MIPTVQWNNGQVRILDQTALPERVQFVDCREYEEVAEAIRTLKVRGAPAIGVTAALGIALGAGQFEGSDHRAFHSFFLQVCATLAATRPTAVNLFWAVQRMKDRCSKEMANPVASIQARLREEAQDILQEDVRINKELGRRGGEIIQDGDQILTHCNAGALATAGYGTALGVVRAAWEAGKRIRVFADETRPVLQGARLTAWELQQDGIPVTLITDNMAGALMKQGKVHCCVVGADRIAANGDVANKIGTYSVAVLAKAHGIPFYVAAPASTIDMRTPTGESIPIEERSSLEVTRLYDGPAIAPSGVEVWNPAFDVTPAELIAGIMTERGVFPPQELSRHFQ
ncbi:MAG: S-methyl-5-thioribose-1-phosphate isomerase [Nitrospirales bacterium]